MHETPRHLWRGSLRKIIFDGLKNKASEFGKNLHEDIAYKFTNYQVPMSYLNLNRVLPDYCHEMLRGGTYYQLVNYKHIEKESSTFDNAKSEFDAEAVYQAYKSGLKFDDLVLVVNRKKTPSVVDASASQKLVKRGIRDTSTFAAESISEENSKKYGGLIADMAIKDKKSSISLEAEAYLYKHVPARDYSITYIGVIP
ncbi:MAG: hypothetical protein ABIF85_05745 [Nanoarchaeota archaeon]|nr:hypothetical protein [Nanoarchaeota archaeon]MBU4452214.1 hypothetical protein [Nanoarchaeota archaeon]MCG2723600.1 hypothetical protein [archaeon]